MQIERAEFVPAWWRIGESLRDYFDVPTELPAKLRTLVKKLDAIEGNYLLRRSDLTVDPTQEAAE